MDKDDLIKKAVDRITNSETESLIKLLRKIGIGDDYIIAGLLCIDSHTEYYKVLYDRINKQKESYTLDMYKKDVVDLFE